MTFLRLLAISLCVATIFASTASRADTPPQNMPAGTYHADKTHTSLIWKVSHLGLSHYTARFTDVDATLDYNPDDVTISTLTATVNIASLETDYPVTADTDFNKKLRERKDWFNADTYPVATFASTAIVPTGEHTADVSGNLTLLGITKPLTMAVTFNKAMLAQPFSQKPTMGFSATATLKRSDWGMDTYVPNIGDNVTLIIETELARDHDEK